MEIKLKQHKQVGICPITRAFWKKWGGGGGNTEAKRKGGGGGERGRQTITRIEMTNF